jgi:ribosomal protein S18 acetylase RimI-like enzyme
MSYFVRYPDSFTRELAMEIRPLAHMTEEAICAAHNEFFADYAIPIVMTPQILHSNNVRRSVSYSLSIGAFADDLCVGFVLVGDGTWNGRKTAYDAGTAVSPAHRGKGISNLMLDFLFKELKHRNYELFLLEVLCSNEPAFNLYRKAGFEITRKLNCYRGSVSTKVLNAPTPEAIFLKDVSPFNAELCASFWDSSPSWQNSTASLAALLERPTLIGAFSRSDNSLLGYIAARINGDKVEVIQMAVSKHHRRQGYGTALLKQLCSRVGSQPIVRLVNIDESNLSAHHFLTRTAELNIDVTQYEMMKQI